MLHGAAAPERSLFWTRCHDYKSMRLPSLSCRHIRHSISPPNSEPLVHNMTYPNEKSNVSQHEETSSSIMDTGVTPNANINHPQSWATWRLIANTIIIGCSFGLFGYDNNFAAPLAALPLFIAKYQGPGGFPFTARNLNLVISVPLVGAALGTFVAAPLMKYIGRKKTFLVAYFLFCTPGSILQLFAPNLAALVIGRFWNCERSPVHLPI
jgi:hypothetical protein